MHSNEQTPRTTVRRLVRTVDKGSPRPRGYAANLVFATNPVFTQPVGFLRLCAAGRTSSTISGISNPIFSSMISVRAMSAKPRFPVLLKNGLAPAFNCRTRRQIYQDVRIFDYFRCPFNKVSV